MGTFLIFHPYDEQRPAGLHEPLQTTIAIVRMMFSGVFDRFPNLQIKVPHAGGFLPYQIERFQHAADFRPEPRSKGFKGRPVDVLKKLYYDTMVFQPLYLRHLVEIVGVDRVMAGTDFPFDMGEEDPLGLIDQVEGLSDADREAMKGGNAERLFGV